MLLQPVIVSCITYDLRVCAYACVRECVCVCVYLYYEIEIYDQRFGKVVNAVESELAPVWRVFGSILCKNCIIFIQFYAPGVRDV